ncbi:MAG: aldose epimerase family protein [Rikenellaceae bacterium]
MRLLTLLFGAALLFNSCTSTPQLADSELLDSTKYDTIIDNKPVKLYTLANDNIKVQITNYGGRMLSMLVPDRDGVIRNINWREESIKDVLESPYIYSGAIIGRSANLSGNGGVARIDGTDYQLSVNSSNQHNAGGVTGLSFCVWDAEQVVNKDGEPALILKYFSEDGHEGYPGNLYITATYTLKESALELAFEATTDAPTYVNFTSHPFFNLHGSKMIPTNSHLLMVNANSYTPAADDGPLTGEIITVDGTPFDFREARTIGERVDDDHPQLARRDGYDVNFMINKGDVDDMVLFAELYEPATGIAVEIESDQPAMQLYGGPFQGKKTFETRSDPRPLRYGVGLEAQNCPNAINCSAFPDAVLYPEDVYKKRIVYNFYTK